MARKGKPIGYDFAHHGISRVGLEHLFELGNLCKTGPPGRAISGLGEDDLSVELYRVERR